MLKQTGIRQKNSKAASTRQVQGLGSHANVQHFCKELSRVNSEIVLTTVGEIARLRENMILNVLAIGERLSKLRRIVGPEKFSEFMTRVLPALGISRSTGYRWLGFVEKLALIFPNPFVRQQLMALTDGKGIVTSAGKDDNSKSVKVILTPAAQAALKILPPVPKSEQGRAKSECWARQFIKATAKARARVRVPGRNLHKDREIITRSFRRFAAYYGTQAAEDLCGELDKLLNGIVENGSASPLHLSVPT